MVQFVLFLDAPQDGDRILDRWRLNVDRLEPAFESGVLIRVTADTIALSPPLIVDKPQIERIFGTIREALTSVA